MRRVSKKYALAHVPTKVKTLGAFEITLPPKFGTGRKKTVLRSKGEGEMSIRPKIGIGGG